MRIKRIYVSPKIMVQPKLRVLHFGKHRLGNISTRKAEHNKETREGVQELGFTQERIPKTTLSFFQSIHLFSSIHMPISNSAFVFKHC